MSVCLYVCAIKTQRQIIFKSGASMINEPKKKPSTDPINETHRSQSEFIYVVAHKRIERAKKIHSNRISDHLSCLVRLAYDVNQLGFSLDWIISGALCGLPKQFRIITNLIQPEITANKVYIISVEFSVSRTGCLFVCPTNAQVENR